MFIPQISLLPYDSNLEFPRERLRLGKQIGSGAFGRVRQAWALGKRSNRLAPELLGGCSRPGH